MFLVWGVHIYSADDILTPCDITPIFQGTPLQVYEYFILGLQFQVIHANILC